MIENDASRVVLGRQPIFDRHDQTVGYAVMIEGEKADERIASALAHLLVDFGIERLVGRHDAWVDLPPSYLERGLPVAVPSGKLVVQMLADAEPTPALVEALWALRKRGYRIVVGDACLCSERVALLDVAHLVKVSAHRLDRVRRRMIGLQKRKVGIVASDVDTPEALAECRELGLSMFQGYYLCRPVITESRTPPTNRLALVRLLAEVQSPRASLQHIEQLVAQDPMLSYRILRYCNSSLFSLPREIESIQHAVVLLGLDGVRNLVTLLAVGRTADGPQELLSLALTRARAAETLATRIVGASPEALFTVGLFSLLDALLERPMVEILGAVPLAPELSAALLQREGPLGFVLRALEHHEQAEFQEVRGLGLDPLAVSRAWLEAIDWTEKLRAMMSESGALPPARRSSSGTMPARKGSSGTAHAHARRK